MKIKRLAFLLIFFICLLVPNDNLSAQVWSVIASGGGHAESGSFTLDGTIGQPFVGIADAAPYELCSGFWCGAGGGYWIYLPVILR
jgi:hypothetical protein